MRLRRRKAIARAEQRASLFQQAEDAMFQVTFSGFAAAVAEQRSDTARADAYRIQAAKYRLTAAQLRIQAERCRPWWTRPRAAVREWSHGLFATWSGRPDDPGMNRNLAVTQRR